MRREGNSDFHCRGVEERNVRCGTAGFAARGKGGNAMAILSEARKESHDIPEPVVTVEPGIHKEWWA